MLDQLRAKVQNLPTARTVLGLPWAQGFRSWLTPIAAAPKPTGVVKKEVAAHADQAFRGFGHFLTPSAVAGNVARPPVSGPSSGVPADTHSLPYRGGSRA